MSNQHRVDHRPDAAWRLSDPNHHRMFPDRRDGWIRYPGDRFCRNGDLVFSGHSYHCFRKSFFGRPVRRDAGGVRPGTIRRSIRPPMDAGQFSPMFSLFSLLTPHATDLFWFLLCRFFAGLGLGGAIPNLLALSSEYAPRRIRGTLTGVLFDGFPLGGAAGALISAQLLPTFGWPALFYLGGAIPLLLAGLVAFALPESLPFLLRRPDGQRQVGLVVRRISPGTAA